MGLFDQLPRLRQAALAIALLCLPQTAPAQEVANLVADTVEVQGNNTLIAEGNVEVLYGTSRLKATRITYDRDADLLTIDGPLTIIDGDAALILADHAQLDPKLENGVLTSARLVLDQQLQLAAAEMTRADGRYTQLFKTVASSCQVCASNPVPLWQIRARKIVHDQQERQLYFYDAQFRVAGVPVAYFPRLRLPDPTLKRARGFLFPTIRTTSQLGYGIKAPYFIPIGDHSDLTLTPYVSPKTRTLEFRYRRAFEKGDIEVNGAFSDDTLTPDGRSYLFVTGGFDLPKQFRLTLDLKAVSDSAYLLDYDYGYQDRLPSTVGITRTRRNEYIGAAFTIYRSLRIAEVDETQPSTLVGGTYQRRFSAPLIGGNSMFTFDLQGHQRKSNSAVDSDGDGIADGLDVLRASARLDWRRNWTLRNGIQISGLAQTNLDFYATNDDPAYAAELSHLTRFAALELRWPWVKSTAGGASHVIEPIAQLVYSAKTGAIVPNEDSRMVEFDEGNLFSLSRFPGYDVYERGQRANLGVSYTRYDPAGWSLGVTVGRILRRADLGQFPAGSGLDGTTSDWLAAVQFDLGDRVSVLNRAIFDGGFDLTKTETRLKWKNEKLDLTTGYIWMDAAPLDYRPLDTSELTVEAGYQVSRQYRSNVNWRYDFIANRAASAELGLQYRNECAQVDLSLSRRFTSSANVAPSTSVDLTVQLSGFGAGGDSSAYAKSCTK
ncbi:LPS-assembly protein LptD [Pseudogemmobacter sp. W21_MBD1_M6]|uniref:LPS-assembly protein LptD n=1 Tax=Pseudogemmobacter sp. W21_MBD1_M6 TaxID=3240271 RepID=UPI003F9EB90B